MNKGRLVKHSKHRHGALFRQVTYEFVEKGYDMPTALEMARDYLDLHETTHGLTCDEDFSRTHVYIRDKEDE